MTNPLGEPGIETQTPRFAALFDGRRDAYGVDKGAVRRTPPAPAAYEALWVDLYRNHLRGNRGIGVFPVRDDNTVTFAAIDLDEPNFELAVELAGELPGHIWIEKSRSGNAHIWTFFAEPIPAWAVRAVLRAATFAAGRPEVEVFPKQAELRPGMVGNYINLPYFGGERPMVWETGDDILHSTGGFSLNAFLHDAEPRRNDIEEWIKRARQTGASTPMATGSEVDFGTLSAVHVCADYMLEHKDDNPLRRGHRHVVLFNLAKMLLNCEWEDETTALEAVSNFNAAGEAPLGQRDIEQIVANAAAGRWTSTGCDDPIMHPYVSPECPIANG